MSCYTCYKFAQVDQKENGYPGHMQASHRLSSEGNAETGNLLVFVHIPKTAGTTLNSILAHRYSSGEFHEVMMRGMSLIAPRHMAPPKPLISPSKLRRLRSALKHQHGPQVINGHFDMSLARLLPTSAQYVTILREPVERAISHFCHYRKLTADPAHALAMRSTLTEWVSTCGLVEMDNGQTRRLAGEMALPIGDVSCQTLAKAKANLATRFAVVGLTERFAESQILLHRNFNWPYFRYAARNAGENRPRRTEVGGEALAIMENSNRFDIELYRFASELFEQAVSKVDMDRELSAMNNAPEYAEPLRPVPEWSLPAGGKLRSELDAWLSARPFQGGIGKLRVLSDWLR